MRKKLIRLAIILFISVNILLVWLDDSKKVDRLAFIPEWEKAYEADLFETVDTKGVISYANEGYVYFDKSMGSFDSFMVEEGSEVGEGAPLFTYHVHDYATMESTLHNQLEQISGEISAIEDAITEMASYRIPRQTVPVVKTDDEDKVNVVIPSREPVEAELLKEQFIIQKEQELAAKQELEDSIESQLEELQETGDTITVGSPFQGKVKRISETLEDPIIVIENTALQVKGELMEKDRARVEHGDPVRITLDGSGQKLSGSILEVGTSPIQDVEISAESTYPFEVSFQEGEPLEGMLPGYHANLTITVAESLNATAIGNEAVFQDEVWRLTKEGEIELVPVQTGIQMGEATEVIGGLTVGDTVAFDRFGESFMGESFITPLQFKRVPWLQINKFENWKEYLVMGLLVR